MHIETYVERSLELHLFFGRIMKEHALFLRAGFTPANAAFAERAEMYKREFEKLLSQAVALSNGIVRPQVLRSGEVVTEFTLLAEKQTAQFTGIPIDREITRREMRLSAGNRRRVISAERVHRVRALNQTALRLLDGLIGFKETVLKKVLSCEMFTGNYPLLIEHIIREAKLYRRYVEMVEAEGDISDPSMKEVECFWNQIMMEHAQFIRGLLDPTEVELMRSADGFANHYARLLKSCSRAHEQTMTADSLAETVKFRDFKRAGTQGIAQCQIRSVILPLLADHVLREANHYIRLLQE